MLSTWDPSTKMGKARGLFRQKPGTFAPAEGDFRFIFGLASGKEGQKERALACEASALTAELTAQNHIYFSPKTQLCKQTPLASSSFCTGNLENLLRGYELCALSEGKSRNTVAIVTNSVRYFARFLTWQDFASDITCVSHREIRAYILHLRQQRRFSTHPTNKADTRFVSGHTINCYLRSLRAFYSWLVSEEIIRENPFRKIKIPKSPRKLIPEFSDDHIRRLLTAVDTSTATGYRDYCIIITLLDTAMRVSELCTVRVEDLLLEEGTIRIWGKGNKQRLVPIGRHVQRCLWRYLVRFRPEPASPGNDFLFLTSDGRPLGKDRVDKIIASYGKKAGMVGVRCSPHTFRHTAALRFLRNGGDVFSLQKILGHASLEMTRHYCELAQVDIKKAHARASPVDNLHNLPRATLRGRDKSSKLRHSPASERKQDAKSGA